MKVCRITDCGRKEQIARGILEALTDWFEVRSPGKPISGRAGNRPFSQRNRTGG